MRLRFDVQRPEIELGGTEVEEYYETIDPPLCKISLSCLTKVNIDMKLESCNGSNTRSLPFTAQKSVRIQMRDCIGKYETA